MLPTAGTSESRHNNRHLASPFAHSGSSHALEGRGDRMCYADWSNVEAGAKRYIQADDGSNQ